APGAAPQPQPGVAGPQAAVLELPGLRRGEAEGPLPLPVARAETAFLPTVGLAPDGPRPTGGTSVNSSTCSMRRSQSAKLDTPLEQPQSQQEVEALIEAVR